MQEIAQENNEISTQEREELSQNIDEGDSASVRTMLMAYGIALLVALIFIPKIYLANNIYYVSKNIHFLKDQRDALKTESLELQQRLEEMKFNFLTLEIEEIK